MVSYLSGVVLFNEFITIFLAIPVVIEIKHSIFSSSSILLELHQRVYEKFQSSNSTVD